MHSNDPDTIQHPKFRRKYFKQQSRDCRLIFNIFYAFGLPGPPAQFVWVWEKSATWVFTTDQEV